MRWVVGGLVMVLLAVVVGAWYVGALGWREVEPGWEQRLEVQLWPLSVCWRSRELGVPNEIGEGSPPLLVDPSIVRCLWAREGDG